VEPNELGQIPVDFRSLLIESDAGLVLVDTGQGDKFSTKQRTFLGIGDGTDRLLGEMASLGFQPEDVDIVVMTHLHGDHCGGSTRYDTPDHSPGPVIPTFPNARHLVQRQDMAEASFPNERTSATYHAENWLPLQERGLLEIVDGDQQVATGVRAVVAPGHTAGIMAVWVEDGGESLLFLGDVASWAVHFERLAWIPAFDIFPMTSIETKRNLQRQALEKEALLVFQHDGQVVTGRLKQGPKRLMVEPEIVESGWA
jgi:glyoxylase-like metal-dependent hydrolase (beta-lactamase superfamily II)